MRVHSCYGVLKIPMNVELVRAEGAQIEIVKNFFLTYFYDMAQYDDNIAINEYGVPAWLPDGLPGGTTQAESIAATWWIRDRCELYVIQVEGNPAGFVIILAEKELLPPEVDFELMDFYVTPKYRRSGIGRIAARLAFDLHHGNWQVFQLERNIPARTFWQAVINDYTNGNYINLDGGIQQRFSN
jgi:predicted acetyltransferase